MVSRRTLLVGACLVALGARPVGATKPLPPLAPQVERAAFIAAVEVEEGCSPCRGDSLVRARVLQILKTDRHEVPATVTFHPRSLTFEARSRCIVFLQRDGKGWTWIDGQSWRPPATEALVHQVLALVKK